MQSVTPLIREILKGILDPVVFGHHSVQSVHVSRAR